jgi:hypothetical protein
MGNCRVCVSSLLCQRWKLRHSLMTSTCFGSSSQVHRDGHRTASRCPDAKGKFISSQIARMIASQLKSIALHCFDCDSAPRLRNGLRPPSHPSNHPSITRHWYTDDLACLTKTETPCVKCEMPVPLQPILNASDRKQVALKCSSREHDVKLTRDQTMYRANQLP